MDKKKESKRTDDDQSREPGRHPQASEPASRHPESDRPDTLRPGPGQRESPAERESKQGARQGDESQVASAELDDDVDDEDDDDDDDDVDEDDDDIDDADTDDEVRAARP